MKLSKLLFFLALFLLPMTLSAQKPEKQNKEELRKEFREFKAKFIAKEIGLNEEYYKEFAELYNQMDKEKRGIMSTTRKLEKMIKENKGATDEDYAKASEAISQTKVKIAEIEKRYDERFSKILSKKQIYQLRQAEEKFNSRMKELKNKKEKKNK